MGREASECPLEEATEEALLKEYLESDKNTKAQGGQESDDDEEGDSDGEDGQRVGCQAQ